MNHQFDELTKGLAQSVTRRAALKKFAKALLTATLGLCACAASGQSAVEAWVRRCSHTVDAWGDYGRKVVTDSAGNVIVAGYTDTGTTGQDMFIIKYSSSGATLWTNRYNGPGNDADVPTALAVDGSGNVYVTGYSSGSTSDYDYATIKYSSAGVALWTNRYNGPGNSYDLATALAVDGSGNVYVTGYNPGSPSDYVTVAYSTAGVALWTNRFRGYDTPNALAVDGSGNVYVTGFSYGDYAVVKYSGAGVALWTNRYNGPGNDADVPTALAVDGSGNVYVTGDSSGSTSDYDYATIKYSSAGVALWTNRYSVGNSYDLATALAVDGSGNVYVTGYSGSAIVSSYPDWVTVKYSSDGVQLWVNRYNGPGNDDDRPNAVAVDGSGNVYVTGFSFPNGSGSAPDYVTIAYSSGGVALWTNRFGGGDTPNALAADGGGNVYVTGTSIGSGGNRDCTTVNYSSAGVALWTNSYNGPAHGDSTAVALAMDGSGNVYVTGSSYSGLSDYDYATMKYSSAGLALWTNRYNGPGNSHDWATALAVDGSGNVYVTGSSIGSGGDKDFATIAYSSAGVALWTNRYNGPCNGDDFPETAQSIALSPDGSVYVTGSSDGDYTGGVISDFVTIKYAPSAASARLTITPDGSGGYFISFNGNSGSAYRLQRASQLTGPWLSSAPQTAPASGLVEFWDLFPPPGQGFYRTIQP